MGGFEAVDTSGVIAVSAVEVNEWGCPYCGFNVAPMSNDIGYCASGQCGECGRTFVVLGAGMNKSSIGFGSGKQNGAISMPFPGTESKKREDDFYYPELQPHPRRGIPKHERPDERPEEGGEFFRSRGIGKEWGCPCFMCGGGEKFNSNIAAFVRTKAAGERVLTMLQNSRLDYRESEPDWIQVKVGACKKHYPNLEVLHKLVRENGIITKDKINAAKGFVPAEAVEA